MKAPTRAVADNPAVQKPPTIAADWAYGWQRVLSQGRYASISGLAHAAGLDRAYVRRLLNLTLLSPELFRAILDATEPDGLRLPELMDRIPEWWKEQIQQSSGGLRKE